LLLQPDFDTLHEPKKADNMPAMPPLPEHWGEESERESTRPYVLLALAVGVLLLVCSHFIPETWPFHHTASELIKEFGIVLVSVWGVSLFYEHFLAERHFKKFHSNLRDLIRRGEMNAAVCEGLGVLEIFRNRRAFEDKHSLANEAKTVGPGDVVRLTGRSLVFSLFAWRQLKVIVENGATLQLCLLDPVIRDTPLAYLAGYSPEETDLAIHRFATAVVPWLEDSKPKGAVEVRYHSVHLLDSLLEVKRQAEYRVAWDLNFAEGTEERQIFYLDGNGPLGRNLTARRYGLIWDKSEPVFVYSNGEVKVNLISAREGSSS